MPEYRFSRVPYSFLTESIAREEREVETADDRGITGVDELTLITIVLLDYGR